MGGMVEAVVVVVEGIEEMEIGLRVQYILFRFLITWVLFIDVCVSCWRPGP